MCNLLPFHSDNLNDQIIVRDKYNKTLANDLSILTTFVLFATVLINLIFSQLEVLNVE